MAISETIFQMNSDDNNLHQMQACSKIKTTSH